MIGIRNGDRFATLFCAATLSLSTLAHAAPAATAQTRPMAAHESKPSRAAEKDCKWEKFSDAKLGLDAWVQRCDFPGRKGFPERKIDFVVAKNSLAQRWSDGGEPEPVLDVFELKSGESPEQGIRRLFAERTPDKKQAAHCLLKPYHGDSKAPAGVKRYTFLPDPTLAKELKAKEVPGDMPDPPCGDWGDTPDGIQYWEAQPGNSTTRVMIVRPGQDTPLFDEQTLKLH
jgi:hypothetical protein